MSRRGRGRRGSSGVTDKWKLKQWFTIVSPPYLEEKQVGTTPAIEPEHVIGRTVRIGLMDLTGNIQDMNAIIKLRIVRIDGNIARTEFYGYELSRDFVRAQVRNHRSRVDTIQDLKFSDGAVVRLRIFCVTPTRANTSQEDAIRKLMAAKIQEMAKEWTFESFVLAVINGEIRKELRSEIKKIYPVKILDVEKVKVLKLPEKVVETISIEE